jgi:L-ribulokinase
MIPLLTQEAEKLPVETNKEFAIDWMNGRRTPYANQLLKGAIAGLSLGTDAPRLFRTLVESTAFGAKKIMDRFIEEGVKIDAIIALGGVAKKSPFIMQILSDVLGKPIKVARSEQTVALGAAMFASVAAGIHPDIDTAQRKMGAGFEREYLPDMQQNKLYEQVYEQYCYLGDYLEKGMNNEE